MPKDNNKNPPYTYTQGVKNKKAPDIQDIEEKLKEILEENKKDNDTYRKKMEEGVSPILLNLLIESCKKQTCPQFTSEYLNILSAISLDQYIEKFSVDSIKTVLDCPKEICVLKNKFFIEYSIEICPEDGKGVLIRKIKAFWTYLKYRPNNNRETDYQGACGFIERFHKKYLSLLEGKDTLYTYSDLETVDNIIYKNLHIVNGVELFQACLIKKFLSQKLLCSKTA